MPLLQRKNCWCVEIKNSFWDKVFKLDGISDKMKMKLFSCFAFSFLILILNFAGAVVINEILPDPIESDDNEWIEIYNPNNSMLNLSEWFIKDNSSVPPNKIICCPGSNCSMETNASFFIITGNKSNISQITNQTIVYFCVNRSTIGNGLTNDGDNISFYNSSYITSFSYANSIEGKSWARLENGTFIICDTPTPGLENNCTQQQANRTQILVSYPSQVWNNGTEFFVNLTLLNFENAKYNLKIDVFEDSNPLSNLWNGTSWLGQNRWWYNAFYLNSSNFSFISKLRITPTESYVGNASLQIKLNNTNTNKLYEQEHNITILNGTIQSNQSSQTESEIKIIDAPHSAQFGDEIEVEINVYKGDTNKYAVYVYVEDEKGSKVSNKITLHFKTKFSNQTIIVNLLLKCKNESGTYILVAEGLGTKDEKEIELEKCKGYREENNKTGEDITIGAFSYSFTVPDIIYLNKEFKIGVRIESKAKQEQEFLVWSYVYWGPRCYSCSNNERESNAKLVVVPADSSVEVELENIVLEESKAEPGDYKLKIKILPQGLKTPKEFTYNITLKALEAFEEYEYKDLSVGQPLATYSVLETETKSLLKIMPYILVSIALLIAIYLIITKI